MSKINYLIKNIPNIVTGFMPLLARGLRRNTTRQMRLRRPVFYNNNNKRRRRNRQNNGGVEINHADGGLKQNYSKQQTRLVPINCYGRLMAVKEGSSVSYKMQLLSDSYAFSSDNIDLRTELNRANEFVEWRKYSTQYRVKGVNTTINYNYHQGQGDYFPRLLLIYNTDTIETLNLNYENNVMNLDLTKVGTKNYNLKLNKRNMSVNNVDWINSDTSYSGNINLLISQQDFAYFGDDAEYRIIGTVKFTFNVLFRLRDIRVIIGNKLCKKSKGINEFERELDEEDIIETKSLNEKEKQEKESIESGVQCEEQEIATSESGTQCSMYEGISLKPFCTEGIYKDFSIILKITNKSKDEEIGKVQELMIKIIRQYDLYMKQVAIQFNQLLNYLPNEIDENKEIKCGIKDFDKEFKFLERQLDVNVTTIPESLRQSQARIMLHICSNGKKYLWTEKDELTFRDIVDKLMKARKIEHSKEFEKLMKANGMYIKKKNKKKNKNKNKLKKNKKVKNDTELEE